jgi:glycosyltransferase involved in cell wall biosynthesis
MFQGFGRATEPGATADDAGSASSPRRDWSILMPFFNEREYLPATLQSLARQHEAPMIILIDNGSTDGSARIAVNLCKRLGLAHQLIEECQPGKVAALTAGLALVTTPYVATCDADTWYPDTYLANAQSLLEEDGCAAAGAFFVGPKAGAFRRALGALHILTAARVLPAQCHAGGAGQVFVTAALRLAGGFDPARWNLVLEDHEIVHQVMKIGEMRYGAGLWCVPSPRQRDRASVKWSFAEQMIYQASIKRSGDWFFYDFLAARLAARSLSSDRLRESAFQQPGYVDATPYPVC